MKNVLSLILFSCNSLKFIEKKCKEFPSKEMDSLETVSQIFNCKIKLPNNWKSDKINANGWYYVEDNNVDSLGYTLKKVDLRINQLFLREECRNNYNSKDHLNRYLYYKNYSFFPRKLSYTLLRSSHITYGDVYIVKYKTRKDNQIYSHSDVFFTYKNFAYTLNYNGLTENFEKFLPDFQKIIESFKITE